MAYKWEALTNDDIIAQLQLMNQTNEEITATPTIQYFWDSMYEWTGPVTFAVGALKREMFCPVSDDKYDFEQVYTQDDLSAYTTRHSIDNGTPKNLALAIMRYAGLFN